MKILVLGAGGREHAIVWALKKTATSPVTLFCAPGNAGMSGIASCVPISVSDQQGLLNFAQSEGIDLTFVGPEAPLADGIVDLFEKNRLKIAGPTAAAARLEASKVVAKDFMARHGVPTAAYRVVNSSSEAVAVLRRGEFGDASSPVVIKADGLAAGKGVVVASSRDEAERAAEELTNGKLIDAGASKQLVIEEALEGIEASVLVFADGRDYRVMPTARDHKRIGEGDTGPNTGGMGAITDNSLLDELSLQEIRKTIIEPTLQGAVADGFPFKGVLFVGLMLTNDGPKVLEYNVRFGDPETQAILVRLETDLVQIFDSITRGTLGELQVTWNSQSSACVVLASGGYPGKYETGFAIKGLEQASRRPNIQIFHAGTGKDDDGQLVTTGGRVLGVTAIGPNLSEALRNCYDAVSDIHWQGMQFRRDIGQLKSDPIARNAGE